LSKKILITGATGFIGYHLAKYCLKLNWSVTSISTKKPIKTRKLKNVKYLICDLYNKNELNKKLSLDFDYVVNLAGYVDHSNRDRTIKSHYIGCKNLSTILLNTKIKKFIQVGSSIEYGKIRSPQLENKNNKQRTFSAYGEAKLKSTKFLLNLSEKFNFPVTIIRLYLVYGPYQDINRVIPITILNSLKNKKFNCSLGTQLRDFTYIDDVIIGIIKILKSNKSSGEIFNIGTGKPVQIKQVIKKICKIIGKGKPIFGKINFRSDEIVKLYPNINKIQKVINWNPKIKLNNGLSKTINYYKKNG
jgi:nucleoside-diphosphate-sugar epimerase